MSKPTRASKFLLNLLLLAIFTAACAHRPNAYETGEAFREGTKVLSAALPFKPGTAFRVRQGPFDESSHSEPGAEYAWDLDVPLLTTVHAVADGRVFHIFQPPNAMGGCDPKYAAQAWNVLVEHKDGSVSQYTHVEARVKENQAVARGDVIGVTTWRGYMCRPHLHFMAWSSKDELYASPRRKSIPVRFTGVPDGLLLTGKLYQVP